MVAWVTAERVLALVPALASAVQVLASMQAQVLVPVAPEQASMQVQARVVPARASTPVRPQRLLRLRLLLKLPRPTPKRDVGLTVSVQL